MQRERISGSSITRPASSGDCRFVLSRWYSSNALIAASIVCLCSIMSARFFSARRGSFRRGRIAITFPMAHGDGIFKTVAGRA